MTFGAAGTAHGSYCLKDASVAGCVRPFGIAISATSLDGHASPYCGINETLTTCEAVHALVVDTTCASDAECPEGGLCRTVGLTANRCTYQCGFASECIPAPVAGSTCGAGTTGSVSYCGG